jgi:protein-S-isoprenylcysteine O-methyltransferase Ste14
VRATQAEFRHRFWFIGSIFFVGFGLYFVDDRNSVQRALGWLAPRVAADDVAARRAMRIIVLAGAAIAALGAALRTWAAAWLRADVVHDPSLHSERLVAEGPYRHVRNPLYVGLMLLDVGMLPLASALGAAWMLVAMSVFTLRLVGREEAALLAEQGEPFRRYLEAVPRFVPSLRPRVPAAGGRPQWGRAVLGELFIWAMVAGLVVFAFSFDFGRFGLTCVGGCLVYPLLQRWLSPQTP